MCSGDYMRIYPKRTRSGYIPSRVLDQVLYEDKIYFNNELYESDIVKYIRGKENDKEE